ncbi:MAG: riboflavin biosynthesis protein RibF [Candidatus Dormiibacterota bacterium]
MAEADSLTAEFGLGYRPDHPSPLASCLVLGNFDGVHLGHQAILASARGEASRLRVPLVAITFQPHPRTVLDPELGLGLLTTFERRRQLLAENGVDQLWVIPFDAGILQMSPTEFMERVVHRLEIKVMVVGPSFSIGKGAEGKLDFLQEYAGRAGFGVTVVDAVSWKGADVSSSSIRSQLAAASMAAVSEMLGRPFQVLGEVIHGHGVGRQLGFPTANVEFSPAQALPPDGVYVMELTLADGIARGAVGSIGNRPHFGGTERQLEVHCLEDPGEIYDQMALVSVLARLREQETFSSDQALVERMVRDAAAAAAYLAAGPGSVSGP